MNYDAWKTSEPERRGCNFKCDRCKDEFQAGDEYYELDGQRLCKVCAHIWVDEQRQIATYEECYGD